MATNDFSQDFADAAKTYNGDADFLKAIGTTESGLNPKAVSPRGATGIMQLMPDTAKELGVDPTDYKQNIHGGARYIQQQIDKYKDRDVALMAYNWGPGNVDKWIEGGKNPSKVPAETQDYVKRVMANYKKAPVQGGSDPTVDDDALLNAFGGGAPEAAPQATTGQSAPTQALPQDHPLDTLSDDDLLGSFESQGKAATKEVAPKTAQPIGPEPSAGAKIGAGLEQGIIQDPLMWLDPAAQYLEDKLGKVTLGGLLPTQEEARADHIANRDEYEKQYGDSALATTARIGGNIAASLPLMTTGSGIVGAGGNLLTKAAPITQGAVNFLSGAAKGGLLTRAASKGVLGAMQGAGAGALMSGANDAPVMDQIEQGALLGGALGAAAPAVTGTAKYIGNVAKSAVAPFTESGRNKLANKIIEQYADGAPKIDAAELVPGSKPTLAEATGNAGVAGLQRSMRDMPGSSINPFVEREQANALARSNLLQQVAGTPQDIEAAAASRSASAQKNLDKVFDGAGTADPQEAVATIDNILTGPGGKRDAVINSLGKIRSKLVDSEGKIESDPATLYHSVRKQIGDLLDKSDMSNAAGKQAAGELMQVQEALDNVIEKGAPGFKDYLGDYTTASAPINSMKWLQGLNLTDAKGDITLSKVQNALKNVNKLQGASGTNAAKSLTKDQVSSLRAIRDDLLRQTNTSLGRSAGSNTLQNIASDNFLSNLLPGKLSVLSRGVNPTAIGTLAGGGVGQLLGGGYGAALGAGLGGKAGNLLSGSLQAKNAQVQNRLQEILLNPELFAPVKNNGAISRLNSSPISKVAGRNYIPAAVGINNRLMAGDAGSR